MSYCVQPKFLYRGHYKVSLIMQTKERLCLKEATGFTVPIKKLKEL